MEIQFFMFNNFFFPESRFVYDNVEEYRIPRQGTDNHIMLHRKDAICMPDNTGKDTDTDSKYSKPLLLTAL